MSETTRDRKTRLGKFFNFANNGITIAGIVITTLSALLIVTFMIVELSGGLTGLWQTYPPVQAVQPLEQA